MYYPSTTHRVCYRTISSILAIITLIFVGLSPAHARGGHGGARGGSGLHISSHTSSGSGLAQAARRSAASSSLGAYLRPSTPRYTPPAVTPTPTYRARSTPPAYAYTPRTYNTQPSHAPSYPVPAAAAPPTQSNTIHDATSGIVTGVVLQSLMHHHDDDRHTVAPSSTDHTPTTAQGMGFAQEPAAPTPPQASTTTTTASPAIPVPVTPQTNTAPMPVAPTHHGHTGLWIFLILLIGVGVAGGVWYARSRSPLAAMARHAAHAARGTQDGSATTILPDGVHNRYKVKIPAPHSTAIGTPISFDGVEMTNIVTGDSHFPRLVSTDDHVSGYSRITPHNLPGVEIERIILGDGAVFVQQMFEKGHDTPIETALYQRIAQDDEPDIDALLRGTTPTIGAPTFVVNTDESSTPLAYTRSIPEGNGITTIRAHERMQSDQGVEEFGHLCMGYERTRQDGGIELIWLQLTYTGTEDAPTEPCYEVFIGAPMPEAAIHAYPEAG